MTTAPKKASAWDNIETARHEAALADAWLYRVIAQEVADRTVSEVVVARQLGISRTTLRKRLGKHGRFSQPKIV